MSTGLLCHGFCIQCYDYVRIEYRGGEVVFTTRQGPRACRWEACGSRDVRPKGQVERRFRSLPTGSRATAVVFPILARGQRGSSSWAGGLPWPGKARSP